MTPVAPDTLYASPNALAPSYSRFRVAERLLLTGHSHQAWPDVGFAGQQEAWDDAAALVDEKWERAFAKADRVRRGWSRLLDDPDGHIALAASTHELVVRFLSALPLARRPRLVTTDGEFHTIRRQLDRLAEEGIEVVRVASEPAAGVAAELARAVDDCTAAVLVSAVMFRNAHIVPDLHQAATACLAAGVELLVDVYHALNAVPFSLRAHGLARAYVVGGGYKYCQLGEGNCFLRFPPDSTLRPVVTGWFSEFSALGTAESGAAVTYGDGPDRFAGATYDPASHYRAARVFDFFDAEGLGPELLREVSQHQTSTIARAFDALDLPESVIARDRRVPLEQLGGFITFRSPQAAEISARLRRRDVLTDHRGDLVRFGPAPYLSDRQLHDAMGHLGEVVRSLP